MKFNMVNKLAAVSASTVTFAFFPQGVSGAVGLTLQDTQQLREAVEIANIMDHLQSLENAASVVSKIKGKTITTRASGAEGHVNSVDYIKSKLEGHGYIVEEQDFDYIKFVEDFGTHVLRQLEPNDKLYEEVDYFSSLLDGDFGVMAYSEQGDITAEVTAVNVNLDGDRASESGCNEDDFEDFPEGNVALIQRGTCSFSLKAENAAAAGAAGVIIFNQGDTSERQGIFKGTLGSEYSGGIPVMEATFALGEEFVNLINTGPLIIDMVANVDRIPVTGKNIITETAAGRSDRVVLVGSHLDSVDEGPGINDNGSGSAAILELALQMMNLAIVPYNMVRFAWWDAEELGLIGSQHYVESLLSQKEKLKPIMLYLNFDMIGSPNYGRFVYDGDGSDYPEVGPGPAGSDIIESVFLDYFEEQELPAEATPFDGRSDYFDFILNGIPAGGLFTGAEDIMSTDQATRFDGEGGKPFDPCYHQSCDEIDNVNPIVLSEMSGAISHTVLTFAMTTSGVKGTDKASDKANKNAFSKRKGPGNLMVESN